MTAVEHASVADGDVIEVGTGSYTLGESLDITEDITVEGNGATIASNAFAAIFQGFSGGTGTVIRDLIVTHTGPGDGLDLARGTAERLDVRSLYHGNVACKIAAGGTIP